MRTLRSRGGFAAVLVLLAASGGTQGAQPVAAAADPEVLACVDEAEKIERSLVALVRKVRRSTVAVARYVDVEHEGKTVRVNAGVGSGVIIERDGRVLTNVHVIEEAKAIEVVSIGGESHAAEVLSQHKLYDFALLRAKGRSFQPAKYADNAHLRPGHWVLACGNPRGLAMDGEPIVTLGIVSGMGRLAGGKFDYQNAIQTDAEINPGNSGGPLFDLDGDVVGINGKIATLNNALVNVGVGYTIPSEQILAFTAAMARGEEVQAGFSGLVIEPRTAEAGGVVVSGVVGGSPAHKVGMRAGDRITGMNGKPIDSYTDWLNHTALLPSGRTMTLRFERDGRGMNKKFVLGAR